MSNGTKPVTMPGGFAFDLAAATAHVMQPSHTRDVISSRGLEEQNSSRAFCQQRNREIRHWANLR
jgi:hypothetical protein